MFAVMASLHTGRSNGYDAFGFYAFTRPPRTVTWCICETEPEADAIAADLVAGRSRNLNRVWTEAR